jgi:hypothetical protein
MAAMKRALVLLGLSIFAVLPSQNVLGQSASLTVRSGTETVTTSEPAKIPLAKLFKMADVVAVVRVVAGDTESYKTTIYKTVVVTNFKGTGKGKTIYYGPYIGGRLGEEYVVFLRNAKEPAEPKDAMNPAFGTVNYLEVFNQGFSSMQTSYECVFAGKDADQHCDDAVRVCTDYIVLPKGMRAFPPEKNDPPFGCRWVRRSKFISLLDELAGKTDSVEFPAEAR